METWRKCGHDRTPENTVGHCCRTCHKRRSLARYYERHCATLPLIYRNALRGPVGRWPEVAGAGYRVYINKHLLGLLRAAEPLTRACYILAELHKRPVEEISAWLKIEVGEVASRSTEIERALSLTEHLNERHDWSLVRQLREEGVGDDDIKQLLGISRGGWIRAKREGKVSV